MSCVYRTWSTSMGNRYIPKADFKSLFFSSVDSLRLRLAYLIYSFAFVKCFIRKLHICNLIFSVFIYGWPRHFFYSHYAFVISIQWETEPERARSDFQWMIMLTMSIGSISNGFVFFTSLYDEKWITFDIRCKFGHKLKSGALFS